MKQKNNYRGKKLPLYEMLWFMSGSKWIRFTQVSFKYVDLIYIDIYRFIVNFSFKDFLQNAQKTVTA